MTRPSILALSFVLMTGCGAGGDAGGAGEEGLASDPQDTRAAFRIKTLSRDFGGDGSIDSIRSFDYDDGGRVLSEMTETFGFGDLNRRLVYTYEDGRLILRTDGMETETFTHDGGRLTRVERGSGGTIDYRYDESGKLAEVAGYSILTDEDCVDGSANVLPNLELDYSGERLVSITGSLNESLSIDYRDDGKPASLSLQDNCGDGLIRSVYGYDDRGRPVRVDTSVAGIPSSSTEVEFTGDLITRVVTTQYATTDEPEQEIVTTFFDHDDRGLLIRRTMRITDDGMDQFSPDSLSFSLGSIVDTFTYEEQGCSEQLSLSPLVALITDAETRSDAASAPLECAFASDISAL